MRAKLFSAVLCTGTLGALALLLLPGIAYGQGSCEKYFSAIWAGFPAPAPALRATFENGGFAYPVTETEIAAINRAMGGSVLLTGHLDSVLAGAARENGFFRKSAAVLRGIAGGHMFDNGNKRTAQAVYELLKERNHIANGVGPERVRAIIQRIATGNLKDTDAIAIELRGY